MTDEDLKSFVRNLARIHAAEFRGKRRGRFALTREHMRRGLRVAKLHQSTVDRLGDVALARGMVLIDLDDTFGFIALPVVQKWRRPPEALFAQIFPEPAESDEEREPLEDLDDA